MPTSLSPARSAPGKWFIKNQADIFGLKSSKRMRKPVPLPRSKVGNQLASQLISNDFGGMTMKNLFGVLSCLIAAVAVAMGQQDGESKSQPNALQPTGEVLVKALLAADNAQN